MPVAHLTFADLAREGTALKMTKDAVFVTLDTAGIAGNVRDLGNRAGTLVRIDVDADTRIYFGSDDVTVDASNSLVVYAGQPETFGIETDDQRIKVGTV